MCRSAIVYFLIEIFSLAGFVPILLVFFVIRTTSRTFNDSRCFNCSTHIHSLQNGNIWSCSFFSNKPLFLRRLSFLLVLST